MACMVLSATPELGMSVGAGSEQAVSTGVIVGDDLVV